MSSRLSRSLQYDWYKYLIVIVVACFAWVTAFRIYHAPTPQQSLYIFFGGNVADYSWENDVTDKLSADGVKLTKLVSANPNDRVFLEKYNSVGLNSCDVIIVPLSVAENTGCYMTFVPVSQTFGCDVFSQDGVDYGLYLPEQSKTLLLKYFDFCAEPYVVFVSATSLNGGGDCPTDNAWKLVELLINYV